MKKAFINEIGQIIDIFDRENIERLPSIDPEHQENWLKIRKYEYCKRHKDSVIKYGFVEPSMKLTNEEIKEIYNYLEIKKAERLEILEQFKKQNKKKMRIKLL